MKVAVIITLIAWLSSETTASSFWPPANSVNATRDCQWMHWYSNGRCFKLGKLGKNIYGRRQFRHKIIAKNGGKNCTGDSEQYLPCTELEHIATTFLTTAMAASPENREDDNLATQKKKPTGGDSVPDEVTCVKPHYDVDGNIRMAGKPCPIGGTRKEVNVVDAGRWSDGANQNVVSTKKRDILFLIDESSSVGSDGFAKFLRLATALTNNLCGSIGISRDATRVGLLTFDMTQYPQMDFDEYFERADMMDHIDTNVNYTEETRGKTCLVDALTYARDEMLVRKRGARVGNVGAERNVILMTDGCTDCRNQGDLPTTLLQLSQQFREEKVTVITFYVGSDPNCVRTLSGLADGSQCYQVFRALDFDEVDDISAAIERNECINAWATGPTCSA